MSRDSREVRERVLTVDRSCVSLGRQESARQSAFYTELATEYQLRYSFHPCINFLEVEVTYITRARTESEIRAANPKQELMLSVLLLLSLADRRLLLPAYEQQWPWCLLLPAYVRYS